MTTHLTPAEARRLGIDLTRGTPVKPKTRSKRQASSPYRTRCCRCCVECASQAAQERHLEETGHIRYELVT